MKTLLNTITKDEKKRILEMHKNATKRNYLQEQGDVTNPTTSTTNSQTPQPNILSLKTDKELYNKFITLDENDQNKIREFFTNPTGSDWKSVTPFPLIGIIQETLIKYANAGATPKQIPFLEVANKTERAKSYWIDPKTNQKGKDSNYNVIFSQNSPYKLAQIANSAFDKFFNYKLTKTFT